MLTSLAKSAPLGNYGIRSRTWSKFHRDSQHKRVGKRSIHSNAASKIMLTGAEEFVNDADVAPLTDFILNPRNTLVAESEISNKTEQAGAVSSKDAVNAS